MGIVPIAQLVLHPIIASLIFFQTDLCTRSSLFFADVFAEYEIILGTYLDVNKNSTRQKHMHELMQCKNDN